MGGAAVHGVFRRRRRAVVRHVAFYMAIKNALRIGECAGRFEFGGYALI